MPFKIRPDILDTDIFTIEENSDGDFEITHDASGEQIRYNFGNAEWELGDLSVEKINNTVQVTGEDDLPGPSNGTITLTGLTNYLFVGVPTLTTPIEMPSIPCALKGFHGGTSGFIYDGSGAAIRGSGHVFIENMRVEAPGHTIFDVSGDQSTEFHVVNSSFSDASGMGRIGSLGTIDGYRVPAFKDCNFEEFDSGLTYTGTPDKIFFSGCPFRNIDPSSVKILTFDANLDTDIVDITDCYIKSVQSDTVVIDVDSSASIGEVFQYRGNTHDPSVTGSNILTGQASVDSLRFRVRDSYPLEDSGATASLDYDSANDSETVTGSGSSATQVTVPTSVTNAERFSQSSNGVLSYDATFDSKVMVNLSMTVFGANTQAEIGIAKNGLPAEGRTEIEDTVKSNDASIMTTTAVLECTETDTISASLEDIGGSTDLSVSALQLTAVAV